MRRVLCLLGCLSVLSGCASGPDYNMMSMTEIMTLSYDSLCDYAGDRHPRILAEVERRKLTCDRALDYCTYDMGLTAGTGDFSQCVLGVKNLHVQERIADETARARRIAEDEQELRRDRNERACLDAMRARGEKIKWYSCADARYY